MKILQNNARFIIWPIVCVIIIILGVYALAGCEASNTYDLEDTRFALTYDGVEVTNAAILDLGNDGLMIYIKYEGTPPTLEFEDGTQTLLTSSYDILIDTND